MKLLVKQTLFHNQIVRRITERWFVRVSCDWQTELKYDLQKKRRINEKTDLYPVIDDYVFFDDDADAVQWENSGIVVLFYWWTWMSRIIN